MEGVNNFLEKKLKENPITFKNTSTKEEKTFDNIKKLGKFLETEKSYWENFSQGQLANPRAFFKQALVYFEQILLQINEADTNNVFNNLKNHINSHPNRIIFSNSAIGIFLSRQYKINIEQANAAYSVIIDKQIYQPGSANINHYTGNLEAIQFSGKYNIAEEQNRANEIYDSAIAKHLEQIKTIKEDYEFLKENFNNELYSITNLIGESKNKFDSNIKDYKSQFDSQIIEWTNKISDLEKSYSAHLMLEKPAQYWKALKVIYEKKGKNWTYWSLGITSVFILVLIIIFFTFPEWMKGDFKLDHAKGVIILTVLISIFSYLILTFVRFATSAFHLSRDAEERRQLTFFYLSLIKEGAIGDKDREIVLQSLFSRADTGLIKGDGSPTMPNGFGYLKEMISSK
ncbi:MAG: DUF6161 domain-containing protein [Melioribacteraceae bacterium]